MVVKLPASVAHFTNIRFNKSFTHHNDPDTIHSDLTQFKIKLYSRSTNQHKTD